MLCCFDGSVGVDEDYGDYRKQSRRTSQKKDFAEVQLQMNGRVPNDKGENESSEKTLDGEGEEEDNMNESDESRGRRHNPYEVDVLKYQMRELQRERDDFKNRLSWYESSSLTEPRPEVIDVTDQHRPEALAQMMAELYENQWTDAYIYLVENNMAEKAALTILVETLKTVYKVCKTLANQQMNTIGAQIGFITGFEQIPPHLASHVKMYKDERKRNYKNFLPTLEKKARKYVKTVRGLGDYFLLESIETCWLMCIQDPPMVLDFACYPGDVFDTKHFRSFTSTGSHVDYIVWPALRLNENGPLLNKGFAQGRKAIASTSHQVTKRLTESNKVDPRGEQTSRRRDNSAQLSRISESSQEYQSFLSSDYSKNHSSDLSSRRYSSYDSQSQMSRSGSIRGRQRRARDYDGFLKNADFRIADQSDSFSSRDLNEGSNIGRFNVPGRQSLQTSDQTSKVSISHNSKESINSKDTQIKSDVEIADGFHNVPSRNTSTPKLIESPSIIKSPFTDGSPTKASPSLILGNTPTAPEGILETEQHTNDMTDNGAQPNIKTPEVVHDKGLSPMSGKLSKPPISAKAKSPASFNSKDNQKVHFSNSPLPKTHLKTNDDKKDGDSNKKTHSISPVDSKTKYDSISPEQYLTIKVNKVPRILRRRRTEDSDDEATDSAAESEAYTARRFKKKSSHHSSQYTPRNVPSVESVGTRSYDTGRLSRDTLLNVTDNTPRLSRVSAKHGHGHRSDSEDRSHAYKQSSRSSVGVPKRSRSFERLNEDQHRGVKISSQMSDLGYVSQAMTDYTPRNKQPAIHMVKQYPARRPDFSHSIKMRPDSRGQQTLVIASKPKPKIPGTVAAKLRFAVN